MSLLLIVAGAALLLTAAYFVYGRLLVRLLGLDPARATPAVADRDDMDYSPLARGPLLNQHFSAIAAAGPIVGPILAGVAFGWLPALLWIVLGAIFIGGVHDLAALTASIRHRARSIAEVVREHMTRRSHVLFLAFIWLALVYVVVAFTDITAGSFVGVKRLENGQTVRGGGIATASLLYLVLPVAMGLLARLTRTSVGWWALAFLPLVGVSIWAGQHAPLELDRWLAVEPHVAQRWWSVILLGYCFVASVVPMWLLLQPRGLLGGYFLFAALLGGGLGLLFSGARVEYPAFIGWESARGQPLFPMLFIMIACGACSGFHSMVASGTTSKQLRCEGDARLVGYGAMLMESMVAVISLCCVMMLAPGSPLLGQEPNLMYANGIGSFLSLLGVPFELAVSFALLAFATFVYDTLDVCTRLGRYVLQELTGWQGRFGRFFATALTVGVPLYFLTLPVEVKNGVVTPIWLTFWGLFGASNQLLAALTLIGVTVWLWRTHRRAWVWFVTGLPAAFMYVLSMWELGRMMWAGFGPNAAGGFIVGGMSLPSSPVPWVAAVLAALALLVLWEAVRVFVRPAAGPASSRAVATGA